MQSLGGQKKVVLQVYLEYWLPVCMHFVRSELGANLAHGPGAHMVLQLLNSVQARQDPNPGALKSVPGSGGPVARNEGLCSRCWQSRVANPFCPYSIQKCPEPQICSKFVPAIVFGGSRQGAEICQKLVKF